MTSSGPGEVIDAELRYDCGVTLNWSAYDQVRLERLLHEHAGKPRIAKYGLIARELGGGKTMRDVALRVKWMQNNGIGGQSTRQQDSNGRSGEGNGVIDLDNNNGNLS